MPQYAFHDLDHLKSEAQSDEEDIATQWKRTHTKLIQVLRDHANSLLEVDKVMCFALGSRDHRKPTSFVQHLAAATIRDPLQDLQIAAGKRKPIEIIAQDPAYDVQCKLILRCELDIRAVTDLEGFLSITKNTFVVSISPGAPVMEIIADISIPYSGPAAMLCNEISDAYLAPDYESNG
jgi:hypothetical protein